MISLFRSSVKSILPLLLLVLSTLPASADRFKYGDLWFETTSENTCEVTYFKNIWGEANYAFTEIAIPELAVYNGQFYSVTAIGDRAFAYSYSLTSIAIPNSVTAIGDGAFLWCTILTSINIPISVTTIGDGAFSDCSSLICIDVDASNTAYISIDGVLFDKDVTTIVTYPAGKTDSSYNIPSSVTTIGDYAFYECERLTSIVIPSSVTTIGDYAFYYCTSLTSIAIPSSVTTIGTSAFEYCTSLTSIDIPNGVMTIGDRAFCYCSSLTCIVIPSSVTAIGTSAFSWCSSFKSIDVDSSNSVYASIDGVLFNKDFTTIVAYPNGKTGSSYSIPDSVTTIGDYAFSGCSGLTSITIPNSVTGIGDWAFYWCKDLMSIAIPSSVTKIGNGAFYECMNLTDIYNYALVPQVISLDAFDYVPSSATLHVVKGYKDVYEAAEIWNQFYVVDDLELPTAIGSVTTGAPATEIYTLDGRRADHAAKGIGIVRTADGKTRKVMTK